MRADLKEVEAKASRLAEFANRLHSLDKDWSHLKNQEDFPRLWELNDEYRQPIEHLYAEGRQDAINMTNWFWDLDNAARYPTLKSFVDVTLPALERTLSDANQRIEAATIAHEKMGTPYWSVAQMIALTKRQASMADASIGTLNAMKHSKLYREESGEHVVTDKPTVVINTNSYNTNSNINSNHSSVTVASNNAELFVQLKATTEGLGVNEATRGAIKDAVEEMERNVGSNSFLASYQKFVATAADHIGAFGPFLPALAQLLGG